MIGRKAAVSPDSALASDIFDQFCAAGTFKAILHHHRHLCDVLKIKPTNFPHFYPKLKAKIGNWRAQALWNKFDKRAGFKCYNRGKACSQNKVLIIGAGPCGLRAAIEAQLLGARVVVVEKRDRISRNNVLHLWPYVIHDLKGLGAKKFFGKFCAGAIDHISIRQLQCILLKVALILGIEIHEGVSFEGLLPPPADQHTEKIGWRASVTPNDHPVSQFEFDVLIGADGKRNTLEGFRRKEFRGKLAIAITANFINRRTEAEARVEEISGVAFIFNQKFFKDLYANTRIDLENIVYYKDDTHYFVMTAKKHSLIDKGVILQDYSDTARLLDQANVDKEALLKYAKEAADFSTNYMLPDLDFAVNHYGKPDVAMFDFTSMYAAENASRVVEKNGHKLLQLLVGDSLLEPFWPTGSGCARGFLSSMDACWAIRSWSTGACSPLDVVAERESIYRLLGQTTPENLQKDLLSYTLDPHSRYPNLNPRSVLPFQVKNLFETDDPVSLELALAPTTATELPKKRRRRDSQVHPDTLLQWLKRQVCLHQDLHVENMTFSFRNGLVLCAIISRYRPDLLDYSSLLADDVAANNQRAYDILEKELGILPVMTGDEMADCECPDRLAMLSYLSQVYDAFRGEIPHTKHPRLQGDLEEEPQVPPPRSTSHTQRKRASPQHRDTPLSRKNRKRRSGGEKLNFGGEERQQRINDIEENKRDRIRRMKMARELQTEQLMKSLAMMEANHWSPEEGDGFQDYSLFVYRQTAPEFTNRVKDLEMKLLYPDRESRLRAELKSKMAAEPDEDFSERIKELEEKLKGTAPAQKKPRDLLRAIGKIEKTDWNVKEIEKKIEENRCGRSVQDKHEKVPKWSKQQFEDKFQAVEKKLLKKGLDAETATRYAEIDVTLKRLGQKLTEGSTLEIGQRGSNKVSAMAEQFAPKPDEKVDKIPLAKSGSKGLVLQPPGASDLCHFCDKKVYLMERVSAEGKFFHRSCFKCEYCGTSLRVGSSYMFDGEGKYGFRFYCNQHFRFPGTIKQRTQEKQKTPGKAAGSRNSKGAANKLLTPPALHLDRGATPERIEFENLAEDAPDAESEMDEEEWTDRNFGASAAEGSSDDVLDMSDSEEEVDEVEEALMTADETREVAARWSKKHSAHGFAGADLNGQDSCEADDSDDVDDYSEDEESDTATDGEEDLRALELRKQEVRLQPVRSVADTDTGSDTEVASNEASSSDVENSATEISTDSEFEHDGTTPTRQEIPDILTAHRRRRATEEPKRVQVKSGQIGSNKDGVKLEFRPLVETKNNNLNEILSRPKPLLNPRRGDYLLSKTQSTEGIATKMSLELRKKYLLGAPAAVNAVAKSATATALDSRLKNFASSITECQKLLNPGTEISPSMQAFLQTTGKQRPPTSPTITSPTSAFPPSTLRKQKELPTPSDFTHVCGKPVGSENLENTDPNVIKEKDVENKNIPEKEETADCRPRSPAHETSIVVPQIPWKKPQEGEDESVSESESESESSSDEGEEIIEDLVEDPNQKQPLPRLEITDSHGELIDDDVFEMDSLQPGNEGHSAQSMAAQIELARCKIDELKSSIARGENAIQGALVREPAPAEISEKIPNFKSLESCPAELSSDMQPDSILEIEKTSELALDSIEPIGEPFDSIEPYLVQKIDENQSRSFSPLSDDQSCITFPAETELSDWARDGDLGVSEDLDDDVGKLKTNNKPKSLNLESGFSHVCGRLLASAENIDFMDTDPSLSESAPDNKNMGYVRLGSESEHTTPITAPNKTSSSSSTSTSSSSRENPPRPLATTEESTTSEATTVKNISESGNFSSQAEACYWPLVDMSPLSPKSEEANTEKIEEKEEFSDYVQRLQGRISPFHNARDSIDYRKSKQKVEKEPIIADAIEEDVEEKENMDNSVKQTDQTSKKLQELSRERNIQKDLVHEMVMKKVLATKKSPGERKTKRLLRNSSGVLVSPPRPPEVQEVSVDVPLISPTSGGSDQTPVTSKKPTRPVSVHLGTSSLKTSSGLPDTPLTNPDAFSMPDLGKAVFDFKTPIAPPRERRGDLSKDMASTEREKIRESARARARLKSDEELGLSPEDRIKAIKEKATRFLDTPKRPSEDLPKRSSVKTSLRPGGMGRVLKSSSTSTVFDKLRGGDRGLQQPRVAQKSTSDLVTACNADNLLSPDSAEPSTSSSTSAKGGLPRSRDRERRKSIIQAVSDFFNKKATSPSKSPSPTKPDKFSGKIKLMAKHKDKKDGQQNTLQDALPSNAVPPPIPPPPSSYIPHSLVSEESGSEMEGPSTLSALSTPGHVSTDPAAQRARMTKRMARQAQLKRFRMAQEIQRRLEEVEEKQREMEMRGVKIEKALRGEEGGSDWLVKQEGSRRGKGGESDLLRDWFELVRERNELRRYERELNIRAQEIELEDRHARLQQELRDRLSRDDSTKTQEEVMQEGVILREMLETVEKRDTLTKILEEERQRYQDEEKDLEAQVIAKGLRLTPIRKYEYQSTV